MPIFDMAHQAKRGRRRAHAERAPRAEAKLVRPPTLHDSVVDLLRDHIVQGRFAIGERLADAALAERFGVSRTPIREALKVLAAEGLVTLIPRRGARVAGLTAGQAAEIFEVICGLERHAVELAVQRMSGRDRTRLIARHEAMARHFAEDDREAYFSENHAIHNLLVALSGNAVLRETHADLMAKVRRERYVALKFGDRWEEAMLEHERLMAAILRGEATRAGEIMWEHVRRTGEVIRMADTGAAGVTA